ncbi:NAD(P)-dependent dehydrogenase, short-chain alcohol dehydrogenase family [Actinacidiphila alni]|uniref:NAD(P)-dependent dehydrogenase, short-chain alcohol dehydrogenase family n=1 Tax=Actinacidiphila alni TaxID=380248 RepID=A0A1I2MIS7_9ACTN|nr:SDR family NAD(P)-dependent oxidoreductase [Actinacidiphila alni]SFF91404.1 NAD(P)-dependent dehydrogenase, short-chain alcohol dehydrogenase family [Actinacidiphila alni]
MNDGKTLALVTGGGRGIGLEVVNGLADRGMRVLLGVRNPESVDETVRSMRARGGDVVAVGLDVDDAASIAAAAAWVDHEYGRLDVLVNNAGIAGDPGLQVAGHVDLDAVRAVFTTNVFGVIAVTEAMIPLLRRSPSGRIVNVSSSLGSLARMSDPGHYFANMPGLLGYPASKTALNQVTLQYAKALRPDGILVNAADPGPCRTDFTKGIPGVERTAAEGARVICELATLGDRAETGSYRRDTGPVPW